MTTNTAATAHHASHHLSIAVLMAHDAKRHASNAEATATYAKQDGPMTLKARQDIRVDIGRARLALRNALAALDNADDAL